MEAVVHCVGLFEQVVGFRPCRSRALAKGPGPGLLDVPMEPIKTAAVITAWPGQRLQGQYGCGRRLVNGITGPQNLDLRS